MHVCGRWGVGCSVPRDYVFTDCGWEEGIRVPKRIPQPLAHGVNPVRRLAGRCRANMAHIRQSRPDSGLDLSHFQFECLEHFFSCSLLARQRRLSGFDSRCSVFGSDCCCRCWVERLSVSGSRRRESPLLIEDLLLLLIDLLPHDPHRGPQLGLLSPPHIDLLLRPARGVSDTSRGVPRSQETPVHGRASAARPWQDERGSVTILLQPRQ